MVIKNAYLPLEERRNSKREQFNGIVDVVHNGKLHKEEIGDISETGIFLKSKNPEKYKVFDDLTLSFQLKDQTPVKHSGTVARVTKDGIGISYIGIENPETYRPAPQIEKLFEPV